MKGARRRRVCTYAGIEGIAAAWEEWPSKRSRRCQSGVEEVGGWDDYVLILAGQVARPGSVGSS